MLKSAILTTLVLATSFAVHASPNVKGTYGLHLFFDEKEFIDVLTIYTDTNSNLTGKMDVPDDFTSPLFSGHHSGADIAFDVFVPKSASRPTDMIFHYDGRCFDPRCEQLVGFAQI